MTEQTSTLTAEPFDLYFNPKTTAPIIDMQRVGLETSKAQDAIFGGVSNGDSFIAALG